VRRNILVPRRADHPHRRWLPLVTRHPQRFVGRESSANCPKSDLAGYGISPSGSIDVGDRRLTNTSPARALDACRAALLATRGQKTRGKCSQGDPRTGEEASRPPSGARRRPRYYCTTWRVGYGRDQLPINTDKVERQVVEFVSEVNRGRRLIAAASGLKQAALARGRRGGRQPRRRVVPCRPPPQLSASLCSARR
jgi:hypothetical protein